ncbi:hypothetical protein D3C72_1906430 [compost metagenome]
MVAAFVQLVDRLAGFEVMTNQDTGLFELGQHAIDGGQTDIRIFGDQLLVHVLGRQMAILAVLEQLHDTQARAGCFQADVFEMAGFVHHGGWVSLVSSLTV